MLLPAKILFLSEEEEKKSAKNVKMHKDSHSGCMIFGGILWFRSDFWEVFAIFRFDFWEICNYLHFFSYLSNSFLTKNAFIHAILSRSKRNNGLKFIFFDVFC